MVLRDRDVRNAARREHLAQQDRKTKSKAKLARRLATKKAEAEDKTGELKRERLAKNAPRTVDNTREWIGGPVSRDESVDGEDDGDEGPVAGPSGTSNTGDDWTVADQGDKRTRPVQIKSGGSGEDGDGELVLDMAGLEDLFKPQDPTQPPRPILLTTSPRPHGPTYAFLTELQSLLGGKRYAEIFPRKNARFELSKVCKWAVKRGYGAIIVVGEDLHGGPASMTISLLPYGPCAHFRLTNVILHRQISKSANPTSHIPELVLSNFSTPLGLSTGRLLQSLFPPIPNFVGRQVVAIHNQRDFVFFRRFRYMFALREGETSIKLAKERGMDEQLRTRMQEIGPRFTLKLRWLKRGSLGEGRQRGGKGVTQNSDNLQDIIAHLDDPLAAYKGPTAQDQRDEEAARKEMVAQLGEESGALVNYMSAGHETPTDDASLVSGPKTNDEAIPPVDGESQQSLAGTGKRKRANSIDLTSRSIKIPQFTMPKELPKDELPHHRKIRKNASILDSLSVQIGHGRGGMKKKKMEWEWNPRMQVSRRKFAL